MSAFFPAVLLFSLTLTWLRASWSAGTPRLRHVRIDRPVFVSGGAFKLFLILSSSARDLQQWTWRLHWCFAGTEHRHVLDIRGLASSRSSAPVLALVHLHDVLIAPFREWNLLCCVGGASGTVSLGIASLLVLQRSCTAAVKLQWSCCTFWPLLLMFCTCGNFNGL